MLNAQRTSGDRDSTSGKLLHWNGSGQRSRESAWSRVISAVSAMNTKGARNRTARDDEKAVVRDRHEELAPADRERAPTTHRDGSDRLRVGCHRAEPP